MPEVLYTVVQILGTNHYIAFVCSLPLFASRRAVACYGRMYPVFISLLQGRIYHVTWNYVELQSVKRRYRYEGKSPRAQECVIILFFCLSCHITFSPFILSSSFLIEAITFIMTTKNKQVKPPSSFVLFLPFFECINTGVQSMLGGHGKPSRWIIL